MSMNKYENIYKNIKAQIESGKYPANTYLPSENSMVSVYNCTRNTIRRALSMLKLEGYIVLQHGKGAMVVYEPQFSTSLFTIGAIESLSEATQRNNKTLQTKVLEFKEIIADEAISMETGFSVGEELYFIKRLRIIDDEPMIIDENLFLKSEVRYLDEKIVGSSIYNYLENELHMVITVSRRRLAAEKATKDDIRYMKLKNLNYVLVNRGQVFNSKGIMFEYTQSRHHPTKVCFIETAIRN